MAKSKELVDCIKSELRAKGISYKALSLRLNVTESAVKYMFSRGNFSLERLDDIAEMLEVDMSDLVFLAVDRKPKLERLSLEQESELVGDMKLFIVAYTVTNFWSFQDVLDRYDFSSAELVQYLIRLERMGFLKLHENNRIEPKLATNFGWQAGGPIEKLFRSSVLPQFFSKSFRGRDSLILAKSGEITEQSRILLVDRARTLGEYFDELCFKDRKEVLDESRTGSSLIMGIREWTFSPFLDNRKKA